MNQKLRFFFTISALVLLFGCANEIDVASEYKDIPLIYGKLSAVDSVHYIRIQKGFLSNTTSAYTMAKYRDSIYYKENELEVFLIDTKTNQKFVLNRVDGKDYGLVKDTGDFYSDNNILYRFVAKLTPFNTYTISCRNLLNQTTFSATSNLIGEFNFRSPNISPNATVPPIIFFTKQDSIWTDVSFSITTANSGEDFSSNIAGIDIQMFYEEWNANTPANVTTKSITWNAYPLSNMIVNSNNYEMKVKGASFFSAFSEIEVNPNLVRRLLQKTKVKIRIINKDYAVFMATTQAQSSSISSDEALPVYTNVKNGRGIFYSDTYKETDLIKLSPKLADYIACDPSYRALQFLNSTDKLCK